MFFPATQHSLKRVLYGFVVLTCFATSAHADPNNYQRTLPSTTWVITSDADNKTSTGTGVFVDAERRLVVTNAHVVGDSRSAVIFFPDIKDDLPAVKRKHYLDRVLKLGTQGKVLSVDPKRDLALIELPKVPAGAEAIKLAEKSIVPGSSVDIIGNPGGGDALWVYTSGTVRAVYDKKFRSSHGEHEFRTVETQSPIKQGDSGGPVVNSDGELVAIAQSFSANSNLVSFCVDVAEIKAFLNSSWKPAPLPTKVLLDNASVKHSVHSSGHYQVDKELSKTQTQLVFITKNTEYFGRADIRKVWSLAATTKEPPSSELMMRVLRQSGATKIGSWAIEKSPSEEYLLIYVAKLDATASHQALSSTIDYVARLAGAMEKQLNPKQKEQSAEETIAKWLAD